MTDRDLASAQLWLSSLERSRRRRVLAAEARKELARRKTASYVASAAVAAAPMWPSFSAIANGGKDDGGKLTRTLDDDGAGRVLLAVGDSGPTVAEVQRALRISDDGIFGPQTKAALRAFQKREGLPATGEVDVRTWLKLFPTDMIVYAPGDSAAALGAGQSKGPQWAAVSATDQGAGPGAGAGASSVVADGNASPKAETVKASASQKKGDRARVAGRDTDPSVSTDPSDSTDPSGSEKDETTPPVEVEPQSGPQQPARAPEPGSAEPPRLPDGGDDKPDGDAEPSPPLPDIDPDSTAGEMIAAMIAAANAIDRKHYAYRWGGGHNPRFSGPYDCSGAVSAVLHAAGLLKSPMVSGDFMRWGAPGPGAVTIYANAGHMYMSIKGRYFGTSTSNPGGGAGWFRGGPRPGFAVVHVPFSKLHKRPNKQKVRTRKQPPPRQPSRTTPQKPLPGGAAPPAAAPTPVAPAQPPVQPAPAAPAPAPEVAPPQAPPPSGQADSQPQEAAPPTAPAPPSAPPDTAGVQPPPAPAVPVPAVPAPKLPDPTAPAPQQAPSDSSTGESEAGAPSGSATPGVDLPVPVPKPAGSELPVPDPAALVEPNPEVPVPSSASADQSAPSSPPSESQGGSGNESSGAAGAGAGEAQGAG